MTERVRSASTSGHPGGPKMETDLSPRKTMLVVVIVVGCFAVLWPKVFYPMLVGSANQHLKPSPIDKAAGCCDVISETDVNTIKIMSELCGTIIKGAEEGEPLTGKELVQRCRQEVLDTCGIDISLVLQEQVRLGQSVKQILDEVRSLNGSLCLKYNYGVAPWRLGVPHRITVKTADASNIRQERPMHLRSELVHPAFRERGRAIPQPQPVTPSRPPPRVVEGRPGPIPGMRPTIGGAGHVVPPSKQGTSSMSVIMPIYTIGIVIFFTYTLMKILFKKQPDGVGGSLYPPIDPDPNFRKEVFESEASRLGPRLTRENISSKLVVNAMSALLDEVDQEIEARRKSSEVTSQDLVNGTFSNGDAVKPQDEEQQTVKVLGMEMTASCEGGKKWSRPDSPVVPTPSPHPPAEPVPPPQEIYLEGSLPAQSQLLVSESATEPELTTGEDPAIVLSGKMTLSVISLDSENGTEETANGIEDVIIEKEAVSEKTVDSHQLVAANIEETVAETAERIEEKSPVTIEESLLKLLEDVDEPIVHVEETIRTEESILNDLETPVRVEELIAETAVRLTEEIDSSKIEDVEKSVLKLEEETPALTNIQEATLKFMEELLKDEDELILLEGEHKIEEAVTKWEEKTVQEPLISNIQESGVESIDDYLQKEVIPLVETEAPLFEVEEGLQSSGLEKDIEEFLQKLREESGFQAPTITLESDDVPHTLEVESLEKEVDNLIQEALESIQQKEIVSDISSTLDEKTNEISNDLRESETIEQSQPRTDAPEIGTKIDLNPEVSNDIEKLIQEVRNLPLVEARLEVKSELGDGKRTIEEKAAPTQEEIFISEKIEELISETDVRQSEEKSTLEAATSKPAADSQKTEESTTSKEETSREKEDVEIILEKQLESQQETSVTEELKPDEGSKKVSGEETVAVDEKVDVEDTGVAIPSSNVEAVEDQPKTEELAPSRVEESKFEPIEIDDELGSDEELVEEIEEIVYEEESGDEEEEEIEIEVEESDDEIPDERNTTRTESSSVQRVNGERSEDLVEESKYTTVSGATAAENDISDEELTDNEDVEDEEEIIEIEEEIEDDDFVNEGGNDLNHVSGDSEPEL